MISNDTNEKYAGSPVCWFGNLPRRIGEDAGVDSRPTGYPANLLYSQIADPEMDGKTAKFLLIMCALDPARSLGDEQFRTKVRAVWYYLDLARHIEGAHKRQMQYNSRKAIEYSITVVWAKDQHRRETRKHRANELVFLALGKDFNSTMWQAGSGRGGASLSGQAYQNSMLTSE